MTENLSEAVSEGVEQVRRQGLSLLSGTKDALSGVAGEVTILGKSVVEKQKDGLADELTYVSRALRSASQSLSNGSATNAQIIGERAIDRLGELADSLRERDIDQLVADTEAYARSRPVAFVIAAVAIGFLAARLLKSRSTAQSAVS